MVPMVYNMVGTTWGFVCHILENSIAKLPYFKFFWKYIWIIRKFIIDNFFIFIFSDRFVVSLYILLYYFNSFIVASYKFTMSFKRVSGYQGYQFHQVFSYSFQYLLRVLSRVNYFYVIPYKLYMNNVTFYSIGYQFSMAIFSLFLDDW